MKSTFVLAAMIIGLSNSVSADSKWTKERCLFWAEAGVREADLDKFEKACPDTEFFLIKSETEKEKLDRIIKLLEQIDKNLRKP